jgi:hypothetical protein
MYAITECTSLPAGFDSLFNQSQPILEAGTFDWRYLGSPADDNAKRAKMREEYEGYLGQANTKVVYWEKDGHPIHVAAGLITPDDDSYILWAYALYGADAGGSKNWLYDTAYIEKTREFFQSTLNLAGYKVACHKDSSIYNHHMDQDRASGYYEATLESTAHPEVDDSITVATIKCRYL